MTDKYVIAASKVWQPNMISNLSSRVAGDFIMINNKSQLTPDFLQHINPKFVFCTHWSYMIPRDIYEKYECVIFHMTDLPYGRGGSPLQNLICRGIHETKISAIKCIEEVDAGPIYLKYPLSLSGTAQEIFERAINIIEDMIIEIITTKITPSPQCGEPVYFTRRKPDDGNILHLNNLETLNDYIRMLDADGYPRAFIETEFLRFEFSQASLRQEDLIANVKITKKQKNEKISSGDCGSS